jgi:hypothetical protein
VLLSTGNPSGTTLNFTGLSGKNKYFLQVYDVKAQSVDGSMLIRFNSDSGSNYSAIGTELTAAGSLSITSITGATAVFSNPLFAIKTNANGTLGFFIDGCAGTGSKYYTASGIANPGGGLLFHNFSGTWDNVSTVSSINITATQNFNPTSTFKLYGSVV